MKINRRSVIQALPLYGAMSIIPVLGDEQAMGAEQRRDFHLAEFKRACEEIDPAIRDWTDMSGAAAEGGCGPGTVSFRSTGRYEGDGTYESGSVNVFGKRGKWDVTLRTGQTLDGERTFDVQCPGEQLVLTEPRLDCFIGRRIA